MNNKRTKKKEMLWGEGNLASILRIIENPKETVL
jgi:hypothetical protein